MLSGTSPVPREALSRRAPFGPLCPVQVSEAQLCPPVQARKRLVSAPPGGEPHWVGAPFFWMVNCPVHFWQHDQYSNLSTRKALPLPCLQPGLPVQCALSRDRRPCSLDLASPLLSASRSDQRLSSVWVPWWQTPDEGPAVFPGKTWVGESSAWGRTPRGPHARAVRATPRGT